MKPFILQLFILFSCLHLHAQTAIVKPDVIFFRYPDYSIQLQNLEKTGNKIELANLKREISIIQQAIRTSFKTEFTVCPVYFIEEIEKEKLNKEDWSRINITNVDGMKSTPTKTTNFLFAHYEINPPEITENEDGTYEDVAVTYSRNPGIVLRDAALKPLNGKLRYTHANLRKRGLGLKKKKMSYVFTGAYALQNKLTQAFGLQMMGELKK